MSEVWKDILGYEGYYQVSSCGRVRSLDRLVPSGDKGGYRLVYGHELKPTPREGYLYVCIGPRSKRKRIAVHRLVALAFLPLDPQRKSVDHIDGTRDNNKVENLRWVTSKENSNHPIALKRMRSSHIGKKLSKETIEKLSGANSKLAKRVRNRETGEIYPALSLAGEAVGRGASAIRSAVYRGNRCAGYHWEYV